MKRYCVGKIYSQTDFRSEETESFTDVNLDVLIEKKRGELIEQNEQFNSRLIAEILFSDEYKLDIWNEIYLKLLVVSGKEEKLFPQMSLKHARENVISNEDQINYMKNTINNRKKKDKEYTDDLIFSMDRIKSVRKDAEIDEFGSDIIRLWLSESEFRALFIDTEVRFDKYDPNSILNVINNKVERDESYIIIEKILGLELGFYLQFCITEQIKEIEYEQIEKIIDSLIQLDGVKSRLLFLYDMRIRLCTTKYLEEKLKCISSSLKYLEQFAPLMQVIYTSTVDAIMEQYVKSYSYETILRIVKNKKNEYEKLVQSKYIYSEQFIFSVMQRCYKYFEDNKDKYENKKMSLDMFKRVITEFLRNNKNGEGENYLITNPKREFENAMRWQSLEVDKYKNKIQSRIIQGSHKKYTEKAKEML